MEPGQKSFMEREIEILKLENQKMKLRVLGVSELTRTLQDKNDLVAVLDEKNKRLEVAVVRLENRCSNFERKLKSQAGNVVGPRSGQSPFIPGPSRQILEALMKENAELKKAINNVTQKGASGYLEAVKLTQLEEIIDLQKEELLFFKDQINSLTGPVGPPEGGEISMPPSTTTTTNTSNEVASLKKQLIKVRRSMKVKDRFCTLLGQQVAKLQEQLAGRAEGEDGDHETAAKKIEDTAPGELEKQLSERDSELEQLKKQMEEKSKELSQEEEKLASLDVELNALKNELATHKLLLDEKEQKYEDLMDYNRTLLSDKSELGFKLESALQSVDASAHLRDEMEGFKMDNSTLKSQVDHIKREVAARDIDIRRLNNLVEETQIKCAMHESKLSELDKIHNQNREDDQSRIYDLETTLDAKKNEIRELLSEKSQLTNELRGYKYGHTKPSGVSGSTPGAYSPLHHITPHLILPKGGMDARSRGDLIEVEGPKHSVTDHHLSGRVGTGGDSSSSRRPYTQPQLHSSRCAPSQVDKTTFQESLLCRDVTNPPQQQSGAPPLPSLSSSSQGAPPTGLHQGGPQKSVSASAAIPGGGKSGILPRSSNVDFSYGIPGQDIDSYSMQTGGGNTGSSGGSPGRSVTMGTTAGMAGGGGGGGGGSAHGRAMHLELGAVPGQLRRPSSPSGNALFSSYPQPGHPHPASRRVSDQSGVAGNQGSPYLHHLGSHGSNRTGAHTPASPNKSPTHTLHGHVAGMGMSYGGVGGGGTSGGYRSQVPSSIPTGVPAVGAGGTGSSGGGLYSTTSSQGYHSVSTPMLSNVAPLSSSSSSSSSSKNMTSYGSGSGVGVSGVGGGIGGGGGYSSTSSTDSGIYDSGMNMPSGPVSSSSGYHHPPPPSSHQHPTYLHHHAHQPSHHHQQHLFHQGGGAQTLSGSGSIGTGVGGDISPGGGYHHHQGIAGGTYHPPSPYHGSTSSSSSSSSSSTYPNPHQHAPHDYGSHPHN